MRLCRQRSIILASCKPGCKPGFRPCLQPGFRQVRAGLRHVFDQRSTFFCRKPGREPQQVRWFVRVHARQMKCRKNRFKQVRSWLSTWLRPRFQLARIMECGLYGITSVQESAVRTLLALAQPVPM